MNSAISAAFGGASKALLHWPQLTAGRWIDRPELVQLRDALSSPVEHITILVGPPGGGKSALLARLGTELSSEGFALLAIKADQLPAECGSLQALDDYVRDLGAPGSIVDCLRVLASEQPVALLIDQLDALSELMDRRTGRLTALLALVHRAQAIEGLSIVLSSREVEYRHDARLASLPAEAVILTNPPWEDVGAVLADAGIDASRWPQEARETLRNVEHLSVFLRYFARDLAAPVFDTYLSMLEEVFRRRVEEGDEGVAELAYEIAEAMADFEELWVARAVFEQGREAIERLLAADLLRTTPDGRRIGFRHQTMFEFVRARDFARGNASLANWVLSNQEAIHVIRPVLWKALPYLRDADPRRYTREVGNLWNTDALRAHLRWILIGFLGGLQDPRDEEAGWLLSVFDGEDRATFRRKVLMAMTGSPGWFARLRSRLPGLMRASEPIRQPTAALLARAVAFDAEAVRELVGAHWATRPDRRWELYRVLHEVRIWDDGWIGLALGLATDLNADGRLIRLLIRDVAELNPDCCSEVARCKDAVRIRPRLEPSARASRPASARRSRGRAGLGQMEARRDGSKAVPGAADRGRLVHGA